MIQVVANIVNNAAKYTPEGGNITLKTEVHEKHVQLEVIDDGVGIEPDLSRRVFDLFAQAQSTPDRASGGLGLGLALVKSLVELQGGTVTCFSEGRGTGSKFTVCLPLALQQNVPLETGGTGRISLAAKRSLRVMVVDDNVDAASALAMLLEALNHEVIVEHGARLALERARIEAPDVCLLDIGLPEIDGNELAQRLRAQRETAKSMLIAVTGYGQENDHKRALAAGFDHYLVKPVDTKKLAAILTEIK